MKIYDRLYGELKFPAIIKDLLNCPGLLRLRDVRMANNQFVAFPAFASASRYEHSLGVCHLAGICANALNLSIKDSIELMIASLYHDVGTPPFAHAMEEVLQAEFGFNHELHLKNLICGTNYDLFGELARVFCDEGLKLRSICHSKKGQEIGLDLYRIAKIAAGDEDEPLAQLLNSKGMDLDNIDNVIRASSAMGLISLADISLSEKLAQSFIFENNQIYYNASFKNEIRKWQSIRDKQYSAIFESIDDFAYQTMIKKALKILINYNESEKISLINEYSWTHTDSSIMQNVLMNNKYTKDIARRILLCKPFQNLGILYIEGDGISRFLNTHIEEIEKISSSYFRAQLGIDEPMNNISENYENDIENIKLNTCQNTVIINYYPDKRYRSISGKALDWNAEVYIDTETNQKQGALLGLFTPFSISNYKTFFREDGTRERKQVSFKKKNLLELKSILTETVLNDFEVSVYENKREKNKKDFGGSQLGFF